MYCGDNGKQWLWRLIQRKQSWASSYMVIKPNSRKLENLGNYVTSGPRIAGPMVKYLYFVLLQLSLFLNLDS